MLRKASVAAADRTDDATKVAPQDTGAELDRWDGSNLLTEAS